MLTLEKIFRGKELTICGNTAILNKWSIKRTRFNIPPKVARNLIDRGVLILDSGNLETQEDHYIYNPSLFGIDIRLSDELMDELKPIIREIKLNSINV